MSVEAYINFNGNCREAVDFYANVFDVEKLEIMTWKDAPPNPEYPLPDSAKNLIMNTSLYICGSTVMFADSFPGMTSIVGNNITITVVTDDLDQIRSYFNKMKEGGTVGMELQETFWTKLYGSVTDKFGIPWQFSHEIGKVK